MSILDRLSVSGSDKTLSTEQIEPQLNDPIVEKLNEYFTIIRSEIVKNNIKYEGIDKNDVINSNLVNIEKALHERFGIKFEFNHSKKMKMAVLPSPALNENILNPHVSYRKKKEYDGVVGNNGVIRKNKLDTHLQYRSISKKWINNLKSIDSKLREHGVLVNNKKARIDNLPNDYVVYLIGDLILMFKTVELTAEEMTAVILHEVGHAYTHIEYGYRTVKNNVAILDAIHDSLHVQNKTKKETLLLIYEDVLKGNRKDIEDSNLNVATIKTIDLYVKESMNISNSREGVNSEMLADQFTARFGVGKENALALKKLFEYRDKIKNGYIDKTHMTRGISLTIDVVAYIGSIFVAIILIPASIIGTIIYIGIVLALNIMSSTIAALWTNGKTTTSMVYDYDQRRLKRIRNDLIRQIRIYDLPKDVIKSYIANIEDMDVLINNSVSEDDEITLADKLVRKYTFNGVKFKEINDINELIEDLTENELHYKSEKIKSIRS